ncbi:PepSY domain-containing protein [Paracoccus salsus]|uniref:PepSY domain-containing protein n=1 Tax=Paracoccus salsus TaxID=2911061 RepID=UPI001F38E59E|nr:hypothetical protein [Paracoccus salsus]MCF3974512.1 hypothetical protein [Paracoccus salsus]
MQARHGIPIILLALALTGWTLSGHGSDRLLRHALPSPMLSPVWADEFRPLPFHELAESLGDRYRGRLVGARIAAPRPWERDLGAALVYEFRLVTPQRNLLRVRMDARSGRFLEVAGRGQLDALRRTGEERDGRDRDVDED